MALRLPSFDGGRPVLGTFGSRARAGLVIILLDSSYAILAFLIFESSDTSILASEESKQQIVGPMMQSYVIRRIILHLNFSLKGCGLTIGKTSSKLDMRMNQAQPQVLSKICCLQVGVLQMSDPATHSNKHEQHKRTVKDRQHLQHSGAATNTTQDSTLPTVNAKTNLPASKKNIRRNSWHCQCHNTCNPDIHIQLCSYKKLNSDTFIFSYNQEGVDTKFPLFEEECICLLHVLEAHAVLEGIGMLGLQCSQ